MGKKIIDLTNRKFGRLTVISEAGKSKDGEIMWLCGCECGKQKTIRGSSLRNGKTKSCGCYRREISATHRMTKTDTYKTWLDMNARCHNKNNKSYNGYGGRGITVCERWNKFENFYTDMREKPKGMSIERKNNNGNYEPFNCEWATRKEQARNTRDTKWISYRGETKCLIAWAEEIGISSTALGKRLKRHPPQIAFNM